MIPVATAPGTPPLIAALRDPARYPHAVTRVDALETHISWIMLTGAHAYKIKKPVNLGFLDFTTLESRRRYCEEELRLNARLAPALYEAVVAITGDTTHPVVGGSGAAIEYAVKMREFEQSALASNLLAQGALHAAQIDALARCIATFHATTGVAAHGCPFGTPEAVIAPALENFGVLQRCLPDSADASRLATLRDWTRHEYNTHWALFGARHSNGSVRNCHGDLHLGNIVMIDGTLTPFDCIEFNATLRWIDIMSEVAFLTMDLADRGRGDFATRFLNAYLEAGGGYEGLDVLRFYTVYRAMVRAKVHALRATQAGIAPAPRERLIRASRGYLQLAQSTSLNWRPAIILMHGLSGSGKSVIAQALAEQTGAIRLRSDVERKRLSGMAPLARSGSTPAAGLYAADQTRATYNRLLDLVRLATGAGYPVIVDATFLRRWQRDLMRRQADLHRIPLVIVDVTAPEAVLRQRIAARLAAGDDPSEAQPALLARQLAQQDLLAGDEAGAVVHVDNTSGTHATLRNALAAVQARLAASGLQTAALPTPSAA